MSGKGLARLSLEKKICHPIQVAVELIVLCHEYELSINEWEKTASRMIQRDVTHLFGIVLIHECEGSL